MLKKMLSSYLGEYQDVIKKDDIRLLSSSETKMNVCCTFKRTCEESGKHTVCYTTFVKLWKQNFIPTLSLLNL